MGDFNIDLLKCESSQISQDFLLSLRSCYLIPTVDKPTRVHRFSATLIDNIFVNNPDKLLASENIISDITDHFPHFCNTASAKDKFQQVKNKIKYVTIQDSPLIALTMSCLKLTGNGTNCASKLFSLFCNKYNSVVNKYAPMKKLSNHKAKLLSKPWKLMELQRRLRLKINYMHLETKLGTNTIKIKFAR